MRARLGASRRGTRTGGGGAWAVRAALALVTLLALLTFSALRSAPARASVTLLYFRGEARGETVYLEWETGTEFDSAGFYVARRASGAGPFTRTGRFIPARGDGLTGARYSLLDGPLATPGTYWYQLEEIDHAGAVETHGPVAVTLGASAVSPSPTRTARPPVASPSATHRPAATATSRPPAGLPTLTPLPATAASGGRAAATATRTTPAEASGSTAPLPTLRSVSAPVPSSAVGGSGATAGSGSDEDTASIGIGDVDRSDVPESAAAAARTEAAAVAERARLGDGGMASTTAGGTSAGVPGTAPTYEPAAPARVARSMASAEAPASAPIVRSAAESSSGGARPAADGGSLAILVVVGLATVLGGVWLFGRNFGDQT